jgi:polyisoprenoid-binding protein YceI
MRILSATESRLPAILRGSTGAIAKESVAKPFLVGLPIALLASLAVPAAAAPQDFRFDTVHSQVLFSLSHIGFSHPTGRLHVKSGFFRFDEDDWSKSQVDVVVDAASVDMGDAAWNDKLRSHEFFATGTYPTAHFVSTRVEKRGDRDGVVRGKLTLLGVTHDVDLALKFNRAGVDPYTFKSTIGFSATTTLKRSTFGMSKYLPDIGDSVDVRIEVEGLRDRDARQQDGHAADTTKPDSPEH